MDVMEENKQTGPDVQLSFRKEHTMADVIHSVEELAVGSLSSLRLSEQNVNEKDAFHLAELLAQHINLTYLSIKNISITVQSISALIKSITNMEKLVSLSLCGQHLFPPCLGDLQNSLQNNTHLEELSLDNCRMGSEGLSVLSSVLNKLDKLRTLSLNDNGFGDASLGILIVSLKNAKSLRRLSLDTNGISDYGCSIIGMMLDQTDPAFTLSLEGNQITDKGAESLANILKCKSKTWSLKLARNPIETVGSNVKTEQPHVHLEFNEKDSMTNVVQRVQALQTGVLLSFALREQNVLYEDAFHLAQLLAQHVNLENLSIMNNSVTTEFISLLTESITKMHRLVKITLCGQSLNQKCFNYLQRCLQNNTDLVELSIDNCRIDNEGLRILSHALNKDKLRILSLQGNGFGDASLGNLMVSLQNAKSLRRLSLDRNCISDFGCLIIGIMLAQTDPAFTVSLEGNQISEKGAESLANILKHRSKTWSLKLARNPIETGGAKMLVEEWVKKKSYAIEYECNQLSGRVSKESGAVPENGTSLHM